MIVTGEDDNTACGTHHLITVGEAGGTRGRSFSGAVTFSATINRRPRHSTPSTHLIRFTSPNHKYNRVFLNSVSPGSARELPGRGFDFILFNLIYFVSITSTA